MARHRSHDWVENAPLNPSIEQGNLSDKAEDLLQKGWAIDDGNIENVECLVFMAEGAKHVQLTLQQSRDRLALSFCSNPPLQVGCQHKNEGTNVMLRLDDWSALVMATRILMRMKHKKEGQPPEYELVKQFLQENL